MKDGQKKVLKHPNSCGLIEIGSNALIICKNKRKACLIFHQLHNVSLLRDGLIRKLREIKILVFMTKCKIQRKGCKYLCKALCLL